MGTAGSDIFATLVSSLTSLAQHVQASIKLNRQRARAGNNLRRHRGEQRHRARRCHTAISQGKPCARQLQRKPRCRAGVAAGRRSVPFRRRTRLAGCSATGSFLHRKIALDHLDCEQADRPTHHHIVKPSLAASGSTASGTADQARANTRAPSGIGHLLSPCSRGARFRRWP